MTDIKIHNTDCLPFMKQCSDGQFDLAIVDPPYGINFGEFNRTNKASDGTRYKANKYKNSNWDEGDETNLCNCGEGDGNCRKQTAL